MFHTHIHVHTCTRAHTHVITQTHTQAHTRTRTHACTQTRRARAHTHTHTTLAHAISTHSCEDRVQIDTPTYTHIHSTRNPWSLCAKILTSSSAVKRRVTAASRATKVRLSMEPGNGKTWEKDCVEYESVCARAEACAHAFVKCVHVCVCTCVCDLRLSHVQKNATEDDEAHSVCVCARAHAYACACMRDLRFRHIQKKAKEDDEAHRPLKPVTVDDGFRLGSVSRYSAVSDGWN